jgi:hypothetical protein
MRALLMVITVFLLIADAALAAGDSPPIPASLICEFESNASGSAKKGQTHFVAEAHQYSAMGLRHTEIDPEHRTARFGPNATIGETVYLTVTARTWTFVGFTDSDDVTMVSVTTVFVQNEPEAPIGIYRAVDSRQLVDNGEIMAAQNYGHCRAVKG